MRKPTGLSPAGLRAATAVTCLLLAGMLVVTVGHTRSGDPEERPAAAASGKVFSAYFRKLSRDRRAIRAPPRSLAPPGPVERLSPADLLIAVKTTGRYHRQRLELLLDTWISRNMQQVRVVLLLGYLQYEGHEALLHAANRSSFLQAICAKHKSVTDTLFVIQQLI